jgi:hypothetical protein
VRTPKRAEVALERLDHRQLLSVNFTGNVATDFPSPATPGRIILLDNGTTVHPGIPADLQPIIKVSGLDINGIRLQYTPADDVLSIGIQQPDNQKTGQPVIAGDTDNNLNGGTVDPAVQALRPQFIDFPDLGGSETMGVFLDLKDTGIPDIVAGISDGTGGKLYQVAKAVVNSNPATIPQFGQQLPGNTGFAFLEGQTDPAHGAFEYQITHFSQLYQAETGKPLTATSVLGAGAFGNSGDDDGISEAFFPEQTFNLGVNPVNMCPPPPVQSPPVLINPHQNHHVNTAHPELVRVSILGTSGFDVNLIERNSVRLGGAAPIAAFFRNVNHDHFLDETFVFRGNDIKLPPGFTQAEVTGLINNGPNGAAEPFATSAPIFNRDASFYSQSALDAAAARRAARGVPVPRFLAGDLLTSANIGSNLSGVASSSMAVPAPPSAPSTVVIRRAARLEARQAEATPTVSIPLRPAARTRDLPRPMRVSDARARAMAMAY